MHFTAALIACMASALLVSAVNIRNFRAGACSGGNYGQCRNIKTYACCDTPPGNSSYYSSSSFQGLPSSGVGVLCKYATGKSCGRVHASGAPGLNTCLAKTNTTGSYWYDCRQAGTCSKSRVAQLDVEDPARVQAIESVTPDIVGIDHHQFYTNESTPQHVVNALFGLLSTDIVYQDIPTELKKYERFMSDEELELEKEQWGN